MTPADKMRRAVFKMKWLKLGATDIVKKKKGSAKAKGGKNSGKKTSAKDKK